MLQRCIASSIVHALAVTEPLAGCYIATRTRSSIFVQPVGEGYFVTVHVEPREIGDDPSWTRGKDVVEICLDSPRRGMPRCAMSDTPRSPQVKEDVLCAT